ncbi:MAG: hypothetical protein Q9184_001740 [Pyrenodesmia sp. 2 TL-2023]
MSGAIFGKSYPFRGADEDIQPTREDSSGYGAALKTILDRCIPLVVLGRKNLSKSWLPESFRELYQATLVFQDHMTKAYEGEKKAMMRNEKLENNLMASLVRASQANVDLKGSTTGSHQEGLTEEEVYGNVFVFSFAGHDATANSLAIGICLLATRPDIQNWFAEEINATLAGVESRESSYEAVFPRLPRCLKVVYETVRLYTAVAIAKSTGPNPQCLKLGTESVLIPKNTVIIPNYSALHTHPRYWGDDSLEFEPSRWITASPHASTTDSSPASHPVEHFKEPPTRNSPFVGWSGGARSCPGRKFAQVEFVGVLVGLFRDFEVRPVPLKGEDTGMARARLLEQIRTDTGMRLLLQMLHPEKAVLDHLSARRSPCPLPPLHFAAFVCPRTTCLRTASFFGRISWKAKRHPVFIKPNPMSFTGHSSHEGQSFGGLRATRSSIPQTPSAESGQPTVEDLAEENRALKRKIRHLEIDNEELTEQRDKAVRQRDEARNEAVRLRVESINAAQPSKKRPGSPVEAAHAKVVKGRTCLQPSEETVIKFHEGDAEAQPLPPAFTLASRQDPPAPKSEKETKFPPSGLLALAQPHRMQQPPLPQPILDAKFENEKASIERIKMRMEELAKQEDLEKYLGRKPTPNEKKAVSAYNAREQQLRQSARHRANETGVVQVSKSSLKHGLATEPEVEQTSGRNVPPSGQTKASSELATLLDTSTSEKCTTATMVDLPWARTADGGG